MKSEFTRALEGKSVANRRRGLRAYQTHLTNLNQLSTAVAALSYSLSEYTKFQIETYGGIVDRLVTRTPFSRYEAIEDISGDRAEYEVSGFAEVHDTAGTDFEGYERRQIRYLLTVNEMFMFPSFVGAVAEILDAGCSIRTRKAVYRLKSRSVRPKAAQVRSTQKNLPQS